MNIKFQTKKVVITGISGQAGSTMIKYLLENAPGIEIYGVVRQLSVTNHENIAAFKNNPKVHIINGDITDPHSTNQIIGDIKPDYFINFAAASFVKTSWDNPVQVFETNVLSVIHQLEAIRKYSPFTRYYQSSSSEMFGDVLYSPQDEKHPLRPRSPYGASKVSAHSLVKVYRESYNLYAVCGICFNFEGPSRGEQFLTRKITKGVARIAKQIRLFEKGVEGIAPSKLEFEPIVLGNLDAKRDWSFCEDTMDGVWRILNQDVYRSNIKDKIKEFDKTGHLMLPRNINPTWFKITVDNLKDYVLASGENHSVREFIVEAFKSINIPIVDSNSKRLVPTANDKGRQINYSLKSGEPVVVVSPEFYRPAEVDVLLGDSSLARNELGWKPKSTFTDLVKKMVLNDLNS